jgi:parvulin-like peptidyl-prolyl isomerase
MQPRILLPIAATLLALGLTACGGGDETTSSATTTTQAGTTGETTTGGLDTSDLPEAATLREQFDQQLLQILTTTQNMSRKQAECAVKELDTRISDEEIQQAIAEAAQSGQSPQDLIDEAFDAGAQCADR